MLLARAVELVSKARRPLLYVGAGAVDAAADVAAVAELLEAPVSTTFQGKGVLPEDHPLFLWPGFGAAAPPFAREVAASCDLTLAIGCRFGEVGTGSYGMEPPGPLVHVDIDADVLGPQPRRRRGARGPTRGRSSGRCASGSATSRAARTTRCASASVAGTRRCGTSGSRTWAASG